MGVFIKQSEVFLLHDLAMTSAMQSVAWLAVLVVPVLLYLLANRMGLIASFVSVFLALFFVVSAWKDLSLGGAAESVYMPWAMAIAIFIHGATLLARRVGMFGNLSAVGMLGISLIIMKSTKVGDLKNLRDNLIAEETEVKSQPENQKNTKSKRTLQIEKEIRSN